MNTATAETGQYDRARTGLSLRSLLFLVGPLLWAILILFHPYEGIKDVVDRWLVVHVGQLVLAPLVFLAVWRLVADLHSVAATVSRAALVVWAVWFSAYDTVQGIATGLLVRYSSGLAGRSKPRLPGRSSTSSTTASSAGTSRCSPCLGRARGSSSRSRLRSPCTRRVRAEPSSL